VNAQVLRLTGFTGILSVAALRALVSVQPQVLFDVDPARDAAPMLAIGPVGSGILDLVLLVSAALALLGELLAGNGIRRLPLALAAVGSACAGLHAIGSSIDAFRGGTWIAAAFAFVALAHLVRERRLRIAALAVLVAVSVPLAVRGAVQVTREHEDTVAMYDSNRAAFLAERGWDPDSSAARTYERRLRQPEATGWFGLSNPYSSMMGVGLVGLGALAILGFRRGLAGPAAAIGAGALGCGALLFVNGGKGAIAATALAALLAVLLARERLKPRASLAIVLSVLAVALVAARGFIGPSLGELSVLFRSFYLETAVRIVAQHPVLGVGAELVQSEFMRLKPPNCPEDVTSVHSIFVDWIVALGVFGVAWAAMVALGLRGVIRVEDRTEAPTKEAVGLDASASVLALRIGGVIAVAALILQSRVDAPALDQTALMIRALGLAGLVLGAACAARIAEELEGRLIAAVALAVTTLVLVHAQIELTAWLAGSAVLVLALVAVGTALPAGGSSRRSAWLSVALPMLAIVVPAMSVLRERELDRQLVLAAERVQPLAEIRDTFTAFATARARNESTDPSPLIEAVGLAVGPDRAAPVVAAIGGDKANELVDALVAVDGVLRREAADILVAAAQKNPASRVPMEAAIKQLAASGRRTTGVRSAQIIDRDAFAKAIALAEKQAVERPGFRAYAMRADLAIENLQRAIASRDESDVRGAAEESIRWVRLAVEAQPFNARRRIDLGDALLASGDARGAAEAYEQALRQDDLTALDPLMQLSTRERTRVQTSLERARAAAATPAPAP
jgi:tetratricopeptide (TPR) repeat protein